MSAVAIVPVAQMTAANAALALAGFGPGNFSVPCYGGTGATHGALHAWNDPLFRAALESTPGVIVNDAEQEGDPTTITQTLIEAAGAKWGAQLPELPTEGVVAANSLWRFEDGVWSIIQSFDRSTYGDHPNTYPALIRRLRDPRKAEPWRQPTDQYDSYKLVNPFTSAPDECTENGTTYRTKIDNNVWSPSGYPQGWEVKP